MKAGSFNLDFHDRLIVIIRELLTWPLASFHFLLESFDMVFSLLSSCEYSNCSVDMTIISMISIDYDETHYIFCQPKIANTSDLDKLLVCNVFIQVQSRLETDKTSFHTLLLSVQIELLC